MKQLSQKAAILGLGKSGFGSALFLHKKGFDLFVSEQNQTSEIEERAEALREKGIAVETGRHTFEEILSRDWFLISPGISPKTALYSKLTETRKLGDQNEMNSARGKGALRKMNGFLVVAHMVVRQRDAV